NLQKAGFLLTETNFTGFGPVDPQTGQPCELDPEQWGDPNSADFFYGFLTLGSDTTKPFYIGIGGALDTEGTTVVGNYAGQNSFPAAALWFGGKIEAPFQWGTQSGARTGISGAGVYGSELGADMKVSDTAKTLDPS